MAIKTALSHLVAFDPSTKATGIAFFKESQLIQCEVLEANGLDAMIEMLQGRARALPLIWRYTGIVEYPESYPHSPVDPADLIKIAQVAGVCRGFFSESEVVLPKRWNGGSPKPITGQRVRKRLDADELVILDGVRRGIRHNATDAVGIGLWKLGRYRLR